MTTTTEADDRPTDIGGARFYDAESRDRGWAVKVTTRDVALTGMTVLDVSGTEPNLARFLMELDRDPLIVELTGASSHRFTFAWASGYDDGSSIRVQGKLEPLDRRD